MDDRGKDEQLSTDRRQGDGDRWADWLLRGRQLSYSPKQIAALQRHLNKLRDRLLRNAKLRPGMNVLDVGAGTGLVALGAAAKLKGTGRVVACDISHDAVVHCRDGAAPVVGDASTLPFGDERFDVVFTRSVLIYLDDKPAGVREIFRVLKRGGRAVIFEPINEVWRQPVARLRETGTYDEFRPTIDRVFDHYATSPASRFSGWDERDLVRWFEEAGFRNVTLEYEYTSQHPAPPKRITPTARALFAARLSGRPNPYDPSFDELVRELLGEEASAFLERWTEFQLSTPPPSASALAYVTATR
jgi:arsenite methyltransferase